MGFDISGGDVISAWEVTFDPCLTSAPASTATTTVAELSSSGELNFNS